MEGFPVIIEVSSWDCVAQAAKQYYADEVGLAINPNASLLFATELVGAFDLENKVGAFQVVNPEIARCKAEVHKSLLPHVAALSGWARNVSRDVDKVTGAVREMWGKFGASERGEIFTDKFVQYITSSELLAQTRHAHISNLILHRFSPVSKITRIQLHARYQASLPAG